MTSVYLTDFDLDGDICECGQPVDGHPPIPKPSSVTEGRWNTTDEVRVFSREWRAHGSPPVGEGIQITRPARPGTAGGRPRGEGDERVIAVIRANPAATVADVAVEVGVSRQSIYNRIRRMAHEGTMPADVIAWRDRRAS